MPQLDSQMAQILALINEAMKERPQLHELPPAAARAQCNAAFEAFWNADRPVVWEVYNHEIAGRAGRCGCGCTTQAWSGRLPA